MPGWRLGVPGARSGFCARHGKGQTGVLKGTGLRECVKNHGFLQDPKNGSKIMQVFLSSLASQFRGSRVGESEILGSWSVEKVIFL